MKLLFLALLLALGACTSTHELTQCRGSFSAANPGRWQPAPGDLR